MELTNVEPFENLWADRSRLLRQNELQAEAIRQLQALVKDLEARLHEQSEINAVLSRQLARHR